MAKTFRKSRAGIWRPKKLSNVNVTDFQNYRWKRQTIPLTEDY